MLLRNRNRLSIYALTATTAAALATPGCSSSSSGKPPDVDPQAAAAYALEHYDKNDDGTLEPSELSVCPALAAARSNFDTNGDGRLVANEIIDGLTRMYASKMSLTEMNCTVMYRGRPLAGAKVQLRPIEMLGDAVPAAEGVTDELGTVRPAIRAELLPEEFREKPIMYPGLYGVEITHPETLLASRYNTESQLGCRVDPVARGGSSAQFDLK